MKHKPELTTLNLPYPTTGPNGLATCPYCGHGSVWLKDNVGQFTSPMRSVFVRGKGKVLMHTCCIYQAVKEQKNG